VTYPGDVSLRFLIWRDQRGSAIYISTLPFALAAVGLLLFADYVDDTLNKYSKDKNDC
jgi:hypothetical protein